MRRRFCLALVFALCAAPALAIFPHPSINTAPARLPCDIAANAGTPCVAAYSTVRALFRNYKGGLYQLTRASDSATTNIVSSFSGFANMAPQVSFCAGTTCTITAIYNQVNPSDSTTTLNVQTSGTFGSGLQAQDIRYGAQLSINGVTYYGLFTQGTDVYDAGGSQHPAIGYHNPFGVAGINIPTGTAPETVYAVFGSSQFNDNCCFDFGNMETSQTDTGGGNMHSLILSGAPTGGGLFAGNGTNPWTGTDFENCATAANYCGSGANSNASNTGVPSGSAFVTAITKCDCTSNMELKQALVGGSFNSIYSGALPSGYTMTMNGAIGLMLGGDMSHNGRGSFYEGAIIAGETNSSLDTKIQTNISRYYSTAQYMLGGLSYAVTGGGPNEIFATKVLVPESGTVCSITVDYAADGSTAQAGFYSDVGSAPTTLLASTAQFTTSNGPTTYPLTGCISVTGGTYIWMATLTSGSAGLRYAVGLGGSGSAGVWSVTTALPMAASFPIHGGFGDFYNSMSAMVSP